jgi:hypothetical protein
MADRDARTLANLTLVTAGVVAAWFVVTTPQLRALVWKAARTALVSTIPGYLAAEAARAWMESQRAA